MIFCSLLLYPFVIFMLICSMLLLVCYLFAIKLTISISAHMCDKRGNIYNQITRTYSCFEMSNISA